MITCKAWFFLLALHFIFYLTRLGAISCHIQKPAILFLHKKGHFSYNEITEAAMIFNAIHKSPPHVSPS